jgi:hypothetical protein
MRLTTIVLLVLLIGCTHYNYPHSIDGLKAEGYTRHEGAYVSVTGERKKQQEYEVWSKETRDDGRRLHVCVVPLWAIAGYTWSVTIAVGGREAWTYDYGTTSTQPALRSGISCVTSDPLPEGQLSRSTLVRFYH